jgi:hypothetical protein
MGDKPRYHLFLFALIAIATPALAVIDFDTATNGHDLAPDPQDLSRYIGALGSFTGTPISARYLVTANHIGNGFTTFNYANGTSVTTTYNITFVGAMDDLALYKIVDSDPDSFSLTAPIYTQSTEVNQPLVVLGRGTTRGAPVTVNGNLQGWQWGDPSNDFTWGVNTVSQLIDSDDPVLGGNFLLFPFTNTGNTHTAALSGGDSGGAVFVKDPADNTYKLAGTNTGVDGPFSFTPTGPFFNAALFDTRGLYIQDGDSSDFIDPALNPDPVPSNSYATRISSRLPFLESHIGLSSISAWNSAAGGDWESSLNWNSGVPNGTTAEADLFTAGITSQTLNVSDPITLAALHFNSTSTYHINGAGSLTIQGGAAPALVQVEQKTAEINIPVTFTGASIIHVSAGATLSMGQVSLSSGATVSVAAHGSEGAGAIQIHALSLGSGAKLDLSDNTLTISDDQPATVASIRSLLASGFNAGSWDGNGIDSSAAHNDASFKTALGYRDTGSGIVIEYTYYGDSNLDGVVNAADFQMLLDGLVVTNAGSWAQGDYTYDGKVDLGNDFTLFLGNYLSQGGALLDLAPIVDSDEQLSTSQKAQLLSLVPEPGALALFAIGAVFMIRRPYAGTHRYVLEHQAVK